MLQAGVNLASSFAEIVEGNFDGVLCLPQVFLLIGGSLRREGKAPRRLCQRQIAKADAAAVAHRARDADSELGVFARFLIRACGDEVLRQ